MSPRASESRATPMPPHDSRNAAAAEPPASQAGSPLVAALARATASVFYRIERVGADVPAGPVLLVANHPNALLDPSVVWATAGRDIRFLAKSTLFERNLLAPLIRRSGAIPVYRRKDEGVDMSRNADMFSAVGASLAHGDAVCLFPEGTSHSSGRLEELRTGAARIALRAAASGVAVSIVPVGLNFDRKAVFRSRVTVFYGPPFSCGDLVEMHERDPAQAVRVLTDRVALALRKLIVEADPQSDAHIVNRVERLYRASRRSSPAAEDRVERRRIIAVGLDRLRRLELERYESIYQRLRVYDALLSRFGLRDHDVDRSVELAAAIRFALREILAALLLVPLGLAGVSFFAVPYVLTAIASRTGPRTPDVQATVKAVAGIVFYPLWAGLTGIAAWRLIGGPWAVVGAVAAQPPLAIATLLAVERELSVLRTVRAYLAARTIPLPVHRRLKRRQNEISDLLDEVYEVLTRPTAGPGDNTADRPQP